MFASKQHIAALALFALLFSNVAGWVHVAEHHVGDQKGVCTSLATAAEAELSKVQPHGCSCSHHRHETQGVENPETVDASATTPQPCGHDHDSDRCTICKAFYAFRHGSVDAAPTSFWITTDLVAIAAIVSDMAVPRFALRCSFARGPPMV